VNVTPEECEQLAGALAYFCAACGREHASGDVRCLDVADRCGYPARAMKLLSILAIAWWGVMLASPPALAQVPDLGRGRALYENHCTVCHTSQVHARLQRIALSRADLREIVEKWQAQQKLAWNGQDVDDVVEFLNRTRYQFP
jgi:mono/diheme cytochrome c family protein